MKRSAIIVIFIFISLWMLGATYTGDQFKKYWFAGKAELTRYSLDQARYGEMHKGEAVLIFVTEPFLTDKQVKYEHGDKKNAIPILKLNFTKRFFTGIYPYTLITSTFTPVDLQKNRTLKVSSSTQEWCGVTYSQLNFRNNQYQGELHSYFQDESDQNLSIQTPWLEDEIWTRIRLAPESLPTGKIQILPGLQYLRLLHKPSQPVAANANLSASGNLKEYTLDYPDLKRKLTIRFDSQFPYTILGWEETMPGGFGEDVPLLTTKATRTNSIQTDYWNKHGEKDAVYREKLGLSQR
ncbi:MAG: septum formation inhibitor Maf [Acidobacteria bacterium]|nr:MAG: septum formation inhibitor Maf [Acidobacteriota bacterium]